MTARKDSREKLWTAWTAADVETLKTMWREKNSASEIATALSTPEREFTRNAIIGKINRLGLQGEGGLATRLTKSKKRKPREKKPPTVAAAYGDVLSDLHAQRDRTDTAIHLLESETPARLTPAAVEAVSVDLDFPPTIEIGEDVDLPISGRVTLFDIGPGVCKWPIGDPLAADFTFCGDACDVAQAYCETHHQIAYRPDTNPKRTAQKAYR